MDVGENNKAVDVIMYTANISLKTIKTNLDTAHKKKLNSDFLQLKLRSSDRLAT